MIESPDKSSNYDVLLKMVLYDDSQFQLANENCARRMAEFTPVEPVSEQIEKFLELYRQAPDYSAYHHINPALQTLIDQLSALYDQTSLAALYRCAMVRAIEQLPHWLGQESLPDSVLELYPRSVNRILGELATQPDDFYGLHSDSFVKDLCLATARMFPGGGRLLEPKCGIPRQLLIDLRMRELPAALSNVLFGLGGFRPLVQFHTHKSELQDFNPDGMRQTYHRVADLLRQRPKLLGLYTASWFNDPIVSEISPRLSYLRELPQNNGAFLIRGTMDENSTNAAISRSGTRRALYERGEYQPTIYFLIWPRKALIDWSGKDR